METIQARDPRTGEIVTVPSYTRTVTDPTSPTGTRLLTQDELQQIRGRAQRRRGLILLGVVGTLAAGGYWWKGWKGAIGVPAGAMVASVALSLFYFGNR